MSAGELREKVAFQSRTEVDDGFGNTEGTWSSQFEEPARIQPLRGSEPIIAQRLQGAQPVVIKVRSSARTRSIDASWRAVDARAGTVYNIRAVTPDEKRRYIDLLCDSGGAT